MQNVHHNGTIVTLVFSLTTYASPTTLTIYMVAMCLPHAYNVSQLDSSIIIAYVQHSHGIRLM